MTKENPLIECWIDAFGDDSVHPRRVIATADSDPRLKSSLVTIVPLLGVVNSPKALSSWLAINQDCPIPSNGFSYRFSRVGHSWQLVRLREEIAAAE